MNLRTALENKIVSLDYILHFEIVIDIIGKYCKCIKFILIDWYQSTLGLYVKHNLQLFNFVYGDRKPEQIASLI